MFWIESKYAKYLGPQLNLFKHLRGDIYNFRCPICGDSDKDRTKTRGYFYKKDNHLKFKCHNCGSSMSFYGFLEEFNPSLFKEFKLELFKERKSQHISQPTKKEERKFKFTRRKPKPSKSFMGLKPLSKFDADHIAVEYVRDRMIPEAAWKSLYYVDKIVDIACKLPAYEKSKFDYYPRLLIPFIDMDGTVTHVQGRGIGSNVPKGNRYITLEIVEDAPKIFGLNTVDMQQTVFVVEGPIDSLFLPNCVAMGGADLDTRFFDPVNTTFIMDHEPRNPHIIRRMNKLVRMGFGVCVWGSAVLAKDINDMIQSGHNIKNLLAHIKKHTYRGLRAKAEISRYKIGELNDRYTF